MGDPPVPTVLPVPRSKAQAARLYDRISPFYDLEWAFQRRCVEEGLDGLHVQAGETVLEIGVGTGRGLQQLAERVGPTGWACGLDLSRGMLAATRRRLGRAGLCRRAALAQGDGAHLPYWPESFHAVFMSFVLELFDTPDIPTVLGEVRRVLRPDGRVGLVSMSKEGEQTAMGRLYERLHGAWPQIFDCRPILPARALAEAGLRPRTTKHRRVYGIPVDVVVGVREGG